MRPYTKLDGRETDMSKYRIRWLPDICKYEVQEKKFISWHTWGDADENGSFDYRFDSQRDAFDFIEMLNRQPLPLPDPVVVWEGER